jgi:ATP-binding cassette subfamily B protein
VLFYNSWILGAIFVVWFVLYVLMTIYLVRLQIPKSTLNAAADSKTTGHFSDIVSNILTVKMFGTGKREIANFGKTTSVQQQVRFDAWLQQGFWNSLFQALSIGIFNIAIIGASVWLWAHGTITAGAIVIVQVYVVTIFNIVWVISKNIVRASSALTDAEEMVAIFDQAPDVVDVTRPRRFVIARGEIVFRGVSFGYEEGDAIFEGLSFTIFPGERVAFVGPSGAGKTTVTKLLLRFADVSAGSILIDGVDIAKVRQNDLRSSIAYVPQDPVLFHRSIRDNIAYGKPDATDGEVQTAAQRARAHEFIERLARGYGAMVGERGVKLSGGERQRVAIARAMLKDAPILVLDEATSSLDSISERYIQEALRELMQGRTTIVIAHRLSTIVGMDRIVVFGKGGIEEDGTHDALLQKGGVYTALWNSQRGGFVE